MLRGQRAGAIAGLSLAMMLIPFSHAAEGGPAPIPGWSENTTLSLPGPSSLHPANERRAAFRMTRNGALFDEKPPAAGSEPPAAEPGVFSGTVPVDSTGRARLPHRAIDPATFVAVNSAGDTLSAGDYTLDATRGVLHLPAGPDTLHVRYRYLPGAEPDTVQFQRPLPIAVVDSLLAGRDVVSLPEREPFEPPARGFASSLRRSGHITRGVRVGTGRDVSLESGLRLSLEGRLAHDVEVNALLDDRNLPVAPEGTSRRLDEIDQVYVEIRTGRGEGRFGDYRLQTGAGRYGTFDRRLEGGRVSWDGPDLQGTAAGAVTRAVFHTNRFRGADGVQGPYRLTGRDGERDFLVIGGSEKVWVDGVLRQRGAAADYTIDYSRGEITFTPSFPISSESRIEVDFEYSPEAYPRNLYAGEASWRHPSDRFRASVVVTQEGDDPDRPFGFEMTPAIENELANAGDREGRVLVSGAEQVEPDEADYTRADTTWVDGETYEIFVFVEPDEHGGPRGDWRVPFSELGAGEGDYTREYDPLFGLYRYEWVGPGQGAYVAKRTLPLPERRRHAAVSFVAGEHDNVTLHADLGVSEVDANVLSARGDRDNLGVAQQYRLEITPFGETDSRAPLRLSGSYRNEPGRYRPATRTKQVEFDRRWGLDTAYAAFDEQEAELRLDARPLSGLNVAGGGGYLERGDRRNLRYDAGASYTGDRFAADAFAEHVRNRDGASAAESDWTRARAQASGRIAGLFAPGIDGEWELRDAISGDSSFTGHRYQRARAKLGLVRWRAHSGELYYERRRRDTQTASARYDELYRQQGYGLRWDVRPAAAAWRTRVELSHSDKRFSLADSADLTTDLASISAGYAPLAGAFTAEGNYQLSRTITRPSALIAYTVPAGEGDYIRVDGEYVYDPEIGDIILRPEPTGDALPTTDLSAALNLDWSPHRLPGGRGRREGFGWEDVSLVTQLEAHEVTRWPNPSDIYLLDLASFQTDSTVEGELSLVQDIYLFRSSRNGNLRLRYLAEKRLSNLYLTGAERYGRDVWNLRARTPLGPDNDLELETEYERLVKRLSRQGRTEWFRMLRARGEVGWNATRAWRFTFELGGLLDHDIRAGENVTGLSLAPGVIFAARDRGRVSADFEALWVETNLARVPFELANGRPKGRNGRGNLRAEYRIGEHLTARATWSVRLDEGREPIHVARVEMSAFF
ncbi:MAG: hypothetical protein MAG453_00593 [Calditrichaeota bacterium]|nr:hypothetical protein [Calditrichota bacterium]